MKTFTLCAAVLGLAAVPGFAVTVPVLDAAVDFAVLGGSTVTNTGTTTLVGSPSVNANLGVSPGTAITGLVTFTNGAAHAADALAQEAQASVTRAYTALALLSPTGGNLTGQDLGTLSGALALAPGVYSFATSAALTGTLELDAQHKDGAYWVFQIGSTLTTDTNSKVRVINANDAGNNGSDIGVFWVVRTSATLGTGTTFEGNILAGDSITLNTSAAIMNGRALARTGAVTLDSNSITDYCPLNKNGPGFSGGLVFTSTTATDYNLSPITIPEPSIFGVLALGLATFWGYGRRRTFAAGGF